MFSERASQTLSDMITGEPLDVTGFDFVGMEDCLRCLEDGARCDLRSIKVFPLLHPLR